MQISVESNFSLSSATKKIIETIVQKINENNFSDDKVENLIKTVSLLIKAIPEVENFSENDFDNEDDIFDSRMIQNIQKNKTLNRSMQSILKKISKLPKK